MKHKNLFLVVALVLGWLVDLLFWKKSVGISFLVWTTMILAGGLLLSRVESVRISRWSLLLGALALVAAATVAFRQEGLTVFLAVMAALGSLWLLALTWRNGYWVRFRVRDHVESGFWAGVAAFTRTPELLKAEQGEEGAVQVSGWRRFWHSVGPIVLGILITLPVVAALASLLASADLVFADRLGALLELLDLNRLPEYVFRLFYILVLAYLLGGLLLHAILPRREMSRPDPDSPWLHPFLGWTETVILLGSMVALFAFFVVIQFQYLFGGGANITQAGYTFAEYARRGFNELVSVAILTLAIYMLLATVSRRENQSRRRLFSILTVLMFGLVIVMMVSAWMRLGLYEQAYGFTQLRTYTHFFIPWLGALLAGVIILELVGKRGWAPLVLLVLCYGFTFTLAAVNVDGYIARQNIRRALDAQALDVSYLARLSDDAIPVMIEMVQMSDLPDEPRTRLMVELACRAALQSEEQAQPWQSFNISRSQAARLLNENSGLWQDFHAGKAAGSWTIQHGRNTYNCPAWYGMD
ncbi:MAG: DUF4173 domain-containing protein [Anaerolineae bacterium]|nr:DUF4173 domain-containing protein [Anaerolineae bacterium]